MHRKTVFNAVRTLTLLAAAVCIHAHASVIEYTDKTAFDNASTTTKTIDFTGLSGGSSYQYYANMLSTSGVTFTSQTSLLFVFKSSFYGPTYGPMQGGEYLNANSSGAITVNFNQAVTAFSFDATSLFQNGTGSVTLSNGQSFSFNYVDTGLDFIGFTSDTPITGYTVNSGYTVLDNVTLGAAALPASVPEPGSVALLGLGLMGFVAARRKRA